MNATLLELIADLPSDCVFLFDMDGTICDSSHRAIKDEQGHIDLQAWRVNNTPEQIALDVPIVPMINFMNALSQTGREVGILTARELSFSDIQWLIHNTQTHIKGSNILSRNLLDEEGKALPDYDAKVQMLLKKGYDASSKFYFYDDIKDNCDSVAANFPLAQTVLVGD